MQLSAEPIIYGLIFLAVLALVEGAYLLAFGRSIRLGSRVNRRLDLLDKGAGREKVMEQLRKEMGQHVGSQSIPIYSLLAAKAQKANIAFTPTQLLLLMGLLSVLSFVALTLATGASLPIRLAAALAMGVGGVFTWVGKKAARRMALLEEQLPDAVELMVLAIVAKEMPDPLGSEMGFVSDEAAYGGDMGECLKTLAERVGTQDLRFLAVAVSIQQQSGGNLAEILDGLAKVIRSRFKLFRRVKAITAEAKWTGKFLSGFPIVAMIGIQMVDPHYYDKVRETPYFVPACLVVAAFLIANIVVMRALVNIKV